MPYKDPNKRREHDRLNREKNRERILAYDRERRADPKKRMAKLRYNQAYYLRNREKFLEAARLYAKQHPKMIAENGKQYAKRHPETVKAKRKRYAERHPDRVKAKARASAKRRRARMAGALCTLTMRQWEAILTFYENRCAYCGRGDVPMTQEHVMPISRGGGHTSENIVPACSSCNSKKGTKTPEEWVN